MKSTSIAKYIIAALLFLTASYSKAYESDTHLRISYVLARAAGLSDAVAKYLSIGNQYVDETATTSAVLLSSQRQLYHFHGDAAKVQTSGHGATSILSSIIKSKLSLAERNHALGSLFLYHGLVNGDLQLFSAGTHTKMDTFGHAGFSNLLGHGVDGHSPDRAFLEPKKYEDMIREMLASYVALKGVLPAEYIDNAGALQYLNKHAEKTHLGRTLTEADMGNAVKIATAVLADGELQSIFREDIYKKYEYKLIALSRIYESFKKQGKINADVTFEELFDVNLIRNSSFDVTDVIMQTILKNAHSEFMKTLEGKDIFDLPKMLEGQSEESYLRRYKMEVERYYSRLKELGAMEIQMEVIAEHKQQAMSRVDDPRLKAIIDNLDLEYKSLQERYQAEELRLMNGVDENIKYSPVSDEWLQKRAVELAQLKMAEEMANHLTKDFIPRRKNEYIKHQFEGDYENRDFENHYKDEAYRRFIHKHFGVNWVLEKSKGKIKNILEALKKFKAMVTGSPKHAEQVPRWKVLAEKAADELILDYEASDRDSAQIIGFNKAGKRAWLFKHLKYVIRASPWITGYFFMKRMAAETKKFAHDHTTEDMRKAVEEGKYRANILEKTTVAYKNIVEIINGSRFRCSYLINKL